MLFIELEIFALPWFAIGKKTTNNAQSDTGNYNGEKKGDRQEK